MTSQLNGVDVSRETLDDLKAYEALVRKWTPKINLVSKAAIDELWDRHIVDSVQLWPLLPQADAYVDLGSGGGFPGLVNAIFLKGTDQPGEVTMIESDRRKSVFLQTVIRELDLPAKVISTRIEDAPAQDAPIVTARALAACDKLFGYVHRHLRDGGTAFLMKGQRAREELEDARQNWDFSVKFHTSTTDANAVILEIGELSRV